MDSAGYLKNKYFPFVNNKKVAFTLISFGVGLGLGWLAGSFFSGPPVSSGISEKIVLPTATPTPAKKCDPLNQKHQHLLVEVPEGKYDLLYFNRPTNYSCHPTYSSASVFFKKGQNYRFPSFLSEYTFFMVNNYVRDSHGFNWRHDLFSKAYHGQPTRRETENFEVMVYEKSPDGFWASAGLKEEYPQQDPELKLKNHASVYLHAQSREDLEEMLGDIDEIKISEFYGSSTSKTGIKNFNWHVPDPNYIGPKNLYRFFLPPGYRCYEKEGYSNQNHFEKIGESNICLALVGSGDEPCQFSSSGCTCCNTGCALVDIALFADLYGSPVLESVLVKGDGEPGNIVFLYNAEINHNPWVSYSASFSADHFKYKVGVENFLNTISSIQRIYP